MVFSSLGGYATLPISEIEEWVILMNFEVEKGPIRCRYTTLVVNVCFESGVQRVKDRSSDRPGLLRASSTESADYLGPRGSSIESQKTDTDFLLHASPSLSNILTTFS